MKWSVALAIVLFAAACGSAPAPPQGWSVDREAPRAVGDEAAVALCNDIRDLAMGSDADDRDLTPTLEELARISAIVGATAALPALNRVTDALQDDAGLYEIHDDLVAAAASIDAASYELCSLPAFTATYATTGWPSCHGELVIPVAGYTLLAPGADPETDRVCTTDGLPSFLPCFAAESPHLPVDCNSDEIVQVRDGDWIPAGEPRDVAPPTTTTTTTVPDGPTTTTTTIPTVGYVASAECRPVAGLFLGADPVTGAAADLGRLRDTTLALGPEIRLLVEEFIAVNTGSGDLDTFEDNVLALDQAMVAACGLPVISAWDALAGGVDTLPCWAETGLGFPAYTPTDCGD